MILDLSVENLLAGTGTGTGIGTGTGTGTRRHRQSVLCGTGTGTDTGTGTRTGTGIGTSTDWHWHWHCQVAKLFATILAGRGRCHCCTDLLEVVVIATMTSYTDILCTGACVRRWRCRELR